MSAGSTRAIFYALAANGGIAVSKFAAAAWTGSGAMLAEAIHSTADCTNQALLLIGLKESQRPASEDYPLGHHRAGYFWSMMVALLLFFVGGAYSFYEGVHRAMHPEPLENGLIAMAVLGMAVALEGFSLWGAIKEIRKESGGQPFLRWFRETRQSELMVVAGEDIAALAGLALAFIAIGATVLTGNPVYDALGSCAVGIVLMIIAVAIMWEVKGLIVGESAGPEQRADIRRFIEEQPEVDAVLNLITLSWGSRLVVAVKARMKDAENISGQDMIDRINAVEQRLQDRYAEAAWVFFEPDVR